MKLKVMLVEDSPMIIKGLQYTIEQAGYDLDVFMSYEHAKTIKCLSPAAPPLRMNKVLSACHLP